MMTLSKIAKFKTFGYNFKIVSSSLVTGMGKKQKKLITNKLLSISGIIC